LQFSNANDAARASICSKERSLKYSANFGSEEKKKGDGISAHRAEKKKRRRVE